MRARASTSGAAGPDEGSAAALPLGEGSKGASAPALPGPGLLPGPLPLPSEAAGTPLFRLDPGWLFLVGGAALIMATTLVPVFDSLDDARWRRDQAIERERFHAKRLENHSLYLDAVENQDPTVALSLAALQLNQIPVGKQPLLDASELRLPEADVFAGLEPELEVVPRPVRTDSRLHRWATDEHTRVWLLAAGALAMLIGLLPASRGR